MPVHEAASRGAEFGATDLTSSPAIGCRAFQRCTQSLEPLTRSRRGASEWPRGQVARPEGLALPLEVRQVLAQLARYALAQPSRARINGDRELGFSPWASLRRCVKIEFSRQANEIVEETLLNLESLQGRSKSAAFKEAR